MVLHLLSFERMNYERYLNDYLLALARFHQEMPANLTVCMFLANSPRKLLMDREFVLTNYHFWLNIRKGRGRYFN